MTPEPLVLIPPIMCDARVFLPQIAALSAARPVVCAPTHCGDTIEDIARHILSWAPPTFALAGMGMGGPVALEIARTAPDRMTRIALIDTSVQSETPQGAADREPLIVAARAGRLKDVVVQEYRAEHLADGPDRDAIIALVMDMAAALGPAAYVTQARAMQRRKDFQVTLRKIRQPALVACGAFDTLHTQRRHEFLAGMIPFAKLSVIEDAGNLPTLEQPQATTEVLQGWLKQPLVLR